MGRCLRTFLRHMSWFRSLFDTPAAPAPLARVAEQRRRARSLSLVQLQQRYRNAVANGVINLAELRQLSIMGVPEELRVRGLYWKLLLGYLPAKRDSWEDTLSGHRQTYQSCRASVHLINSAELSCVLSSH